MEPKQLFKNALIILSFFIISIPIGIVISMVYSFIKDPVIILSMVISFFGLLNLYYINKK